MPVLVVTVQHEAEPRVMPERHRGPQVSDVIWAAPARLTAVGSLVFAMTVQGPGAALSSLCRWEAPGLAFASVLGIGRAAKSDKEAALPLPGPASGTALFECTHSVSPPACRRARRSAVREEVILRATDLARGLR